MEPNTNEATAPKRLKSGGRKPLIIIGIVLAVLAVLAGAAYLACCYLGTYSDTFAPRYTINGVNVGGLTVEQASEKIWEEYQQRTVSVYLSTEEDPIDFAFGLNTASDLEKQGLEPALEIPVSELGVTLSEDYAGGVRGSFIISHGRGFFVNGWNYLRCLLLGGSRVSTGIEGNRMQFWERADAAAAELSRETIDAAYELGEDSLTITVPRDGRRVDSQAMRQALELARGEFDADYRAVVVEAETLPAKTLTAREIYDECSGTVQNASYDAETETIVPERAGADFDVDEAQQLLDAAEPGGTVTVPAQVELPAVTAEELEQVLFRDVLGEARTHVGGTSARRSNVKLSAAAINGYVMNTGDVFSYNGVVGQRTAANGYQAAPAYVKGGDGGRDRRRHLPDLLHPVSGLPAVQSGDHGAVRPPVRPRLHHRGHGRHGVLGRAGLQVHQRHPVPHQDRHQVREQLPDRPGAGHQCGRHQREDDQRVALHHPL